MAWGKAGTTTLTSAGDELDVSTTTPSKFNMFLSHQLESPITINARLRVGNTTLDTGSNYARRYSTDGAADNTNVSQTNIPSLYANIRDTAFVVGYFVNIATEEKLFISFGLGNDGTGSATAPERREVVGKWTNTSNQIDIIRLYNDQGGDYNTDSNISILGSDITPAAAVPAISNVQDNSIFIETDTYKRYFYDGTNWNLFDMDLPFLGVFGGGHTGSNSNVIDYITIATTGNATDFGDLTVARRVDAACDDSSRGLFCGISSGTIDYITIGTTGNATDFGDMNTNGEGAGGVSSETRGCIGGGYIGGGSSTNVIDYVTIQTTGNATDFGDLTVARYGIAGGLSNNTRGCFAGGSGSTTTIDYITIATTGNATDFGDLSVGRYNMQGLSNSTRGCIGGGTATTNTIDYITIATTGNATDFGDLTIARRKAGGVSTETRGVWGGGHTGSTQTNVMDYITIDTTGNATDFGDLTVARDGSSGVTGK